MASQTPQPQDDRRISFGRRLFARFSVNNNLYCVPIDDIERQRYDSLHRITRELFRHSVLPRFPPERPEDDDIPRVLECGFGEGAWIEHFLEEFGAVDEYDVTGIDVFTGRWSDDEAEDEPDDDEEENDEGVQEYHKVRWNMNARFRDAPRTAGLRPESFILINSRFLAEGIGANRWTEYINELRQMLTEGGWLQLMELQLLVQSSSGRLSDTSYLTRWWTLYAQALQVMGKNPRVGPLLGGMLTRAGFVEIHQGVKDIPIGDWSQGNMGPAT